MLKLMANVLSSSLYGRVSMIQVRHNKKMGTEGLSFYHPNLLCCLDQMLALTELSQHLVSSSKTVRPIISRGARYVDMLKQCGLQYVHQRHSRILLKKTPFVHEQTETPNASTQAIEFDPSCADQTHFNGSCADPRNVDIER